MRRSDPFRYDRARLGADGAAVLAGADEVGRGCLAGPLVVAAVALDYRRDPARALKGLTDSKALSAGAREDLFGRIILAASGVSVVSVSAENIDAEGLHRANLRALALALEGLGGIYDLALVDGFEINRSDLRAARLPGGDWLSAGVAAASVIAKVTRDRLMRELDGEHPEYGFLRHVGYGTREHQNALRLHGPCRLHRRSFSLVGAILRGEDVGACPGCDEG